MKNGLIGLVTIFIILVTIVGYTEPVTVEFWRGINQEVEENWYRAKVKEFNELNKGKIVVKETPISRGDAFAYEDKISVAAATKSLPDVILVDGPNVANYAYSDILAPLDSYYTTEDMKDFLPSIIQQGTYDNKFYAVGLGEGIINIYYNKKIFADAGIEVPQKVEDAWTWDEYYKICKKLTKDGVYGANFIVERSGEWIIVGLQSFFISNGVEMLSSDGTKADGYINSPAAIETGEYLQKFAKEGLINIDPTPTEFQEGKAATKLAGTWFIPALEATKGFDWGVTFYPQKKQNKGSATGGWCIGMTKTAKNTDAAVKFIKFLTSKENSISFSVDGPKVPPSRLSAFDAIPEYSIPPMSIIKETLVKTGYARPVTPNYPIFTQKFAESLYDILLGADVKKSLDNIAKSFDEEYARTYSKK
ncbi:Cyclodextrin-binding protein [subsurface metagenome]